jgi:hypothetical protein|tara:strand:- start:82 stop:447 length:366 start_codon:yes stop_codon:yes gene_type:complete
MSRNYPMSWKYSEDLTMDLVRKVDKIPSLREFPYRFNDDDIETYAIWEPFRDMNTSWFFYKWPDMWTLGQVRWDTVAVGYDDMQFESVWSGVEARYVRFQSAKTIEEALENFKVWIYQTSN